MKRATALPILAISLVLALLATVLPATPARAAEITLLSPSSGKPGTSTTIVGYGFTGTSVEIYFSKDMPRVNYIISNEVAAYEYIKTVSPFTDVDGTTGVIDTTLTIPAELTLGSAPDIIRNGTYWVSITSIGTSKRVKATRQFTIAGVGNITLNTISGAVTTEVTVSGRGFSANSNVTISFDNVAVGTSLADSSGGFSATFTVPESYQGSHTVKAQDTGNTSATATFLTQPSMNVTATSGVAGDTVTVSGSGFAAGQSVTISLDSLGVGSGQSNSNGGFAVAFTVPAVGAGIYTLAVADAGGNSLSRTFTMAEAAVSISPTSGLAGTEVTVRGSGFRAGQTITVTFDGGSVSQVTSDAQGSLTASFNVPLRAGGGYQVAASDGVATKGQVFTVTATFSISPTTGYGGTEVIARGQGFQANLTVPILLANDLVTTATTDSNGNLSASFTVPAKPAGTHKIMVSDGVNTLEASFAISARASITPETNHSSPGNIGTELTITGDGFAAARKVTITYDGRQVTTATVSANGNFTAVFTAPVSKGGEHSIMATDGVTTWPFTFFMETTPPPIPVLLQPAAGLEAEALTYFDWEDVTDPNGVTYTLQIATDENFPEAAIVLEKTGLSPSEYTITPLESLPSVSQETPYYWRVRATDGVSNESRWSEAASFYVGSDFSLSPKIIYIILGIGALLLGIFGFWLGRRTAYY